MELGAELGQRTGLGVGAGTVGVGVGVGGLGVLTLFLLLPDSDFAAGAEMREKPSPPPLTIRSVDTAWALLAGRIAANPSKIEISSASILRVAMTEESAQPFACLSTLSNRSTQRVNPAPFLRARSSKH